MFKSLHAFDNIIKIHDFSHITFFSFVHIGKQKIVINCNIQKIGTNKEANRA